jgi:glycosyltransferase involved in cell wall biosynthesis
MMKIIQLSAIDQTMDVFLDRLNLRLMEEGYEVIAVCSPGPYSQGLRERGLNLINIKIDRRIKPISNLKTIYQLYRLFKREKPDLVHVHTPIAAVLGRIAAKMAGVPRIVYTAHGFYFHEGMNLVKYRFFLEIEKFMARHFTDFIFTQSEEDRQTALKNRFLAQSKIMTIGNGVDVDGKFNPNRINPGEIENLYQELHLAPADKIITFIGRLVREKGILDLVEVFSSLEREDVKLLIVGDIMQGSRDQKTKEILKKYKADKRIVLTGYRKDVPNILHITDLFCLPSYREGMPRTIIEAMAMECAVIATGIRGTREEVVPGETGFLFEPGCLNQLRDKLNQLLDDEELLSRMKEQGRKRAVVYFSEDEVIRKQLEVFKRL